MEAADRLSALTADTPLAELTCALSAAAAAAAAESAPDATTDALTTSLLSLLPALPPGGAAEPLARLAAELAKRESSRERLARPELVQRLVAALEAADEPAALVQPCRALGNLCYEGAAARAALLAPPGPAAVAAARAALLAPPGPAAVAAAVEQAVVAGQQGAKARDVVSGLVLNFVNGHPPAVDWVVESDVASQLISAACDDVTAAVFVRHTLVVAGVVCESPRREALLSTRLAPLLAACLLPERDPSVVEEALDTAASWCRHEEAKLPLAQGGVADSLCRLLPAGEAPPDARSLLVELLSGDEAMAAVYRRGEGAVFKAVRAWLKEGGTEELVACACHALGNFATNDDHALAMVRAGVHRDLVTPLTSDSVRLQMSALSLLRNLSLPPQNKMALIEAGLLEHLLELSVVEQPALFKYYGTLRLLAGDSGAACGQLAKQPGLLTQLTAAGRGDGPYGVQHEACRLLARIVRTAQCEEVSRAAIAADGHSCLVRLLQSTNAVMVNEAIMALCYTAPHTDTQQIVSSEFAAALTQVMTSAVLPVQIKENADTLLQLLRSRDDPALLEGLCEVPEPDLPPTVDR